MAEGSLEGLLGGEEGDGEAEKRRPGLDRSSPRRRSMPPLPRRSPSPSRPTRTRPEDKPYILSSWANSLANVGGAAGDTLKLYREAVALKPGYWIGRSNTMNALSLLGREEDAWRHGQAMLRAAGGRPGKAPDLLYENLDDPTWNAAAYRASQLADSAAHGGIGSSVAANGPSIAEMDIRLHDLADADLQLQTARGDAADPTVAAMSASDRGRIAGEQGDAATRRARAGGVPGGRYEPDRLEQLSGYLLGRPAPRRSPVIPTRPMPCSAPPAAMSIAIASGATSLLAGATGGARSRLMPPPSALPPIGRRTGTAGGSRSRGTASARAEQMVAAASRRGPNWADPLKAWGDALAREGRRDAAREKYREALPRAPAWAELRRAAAM